MEFRILGPLEARAGGHPVALGGAKPRAVLAMLVLHAGESVSAERLALALWGEQAPAGAVKTVQVHVSRLRKALGDPNAIATTPAGYRLRVATDDVDAHRFESQLAAGRDSLAAGDARAAADRLRRALALWRGPPLAEFAWAPFAPAEANRLQELQLEALEVRVEADLAAGCAAELVGELERLVSLHPWRERLHAQLMLALYRSGRQAEALESYRRARDVLVEELGIEPGFVLQELQQAILVHDPALEAPALASPRRGAFPVPPNRTIGRAREIEAIAARLRAQSVRLLTLTGPGGVGKTRLALEAARAVEADFADGAAFVSLAAVNRPQDVPPSIVRALAIIPLAGESAELAVERFLAAKHLLLVVDNCEHLSAAAPFIGALPVCCPNITVLATSREPLSVRAEQRHPVPPLALPELWTDPQALAGVDAVELFCERAQAHDPAFHLGGDGRAVAEICRRVDGLPLGIELAAARCELLSPGEIAERLDGALGPPPRDAPARHQTLRATIDWSHNLLDDDERTCFARFAVFSGGASLAAAETVTGASIDTLDRLVTKSLIVRRRQVHGRTRLEMLETVRAYAADRFADATDAHAVRERHYAYFLELSRRHANRQAICGTKRKQHLERLDSEIENLLSALEWAAGQDTAGPLLELCEPFGEYCVARGRFADAVEWSDKALARPGADRRPALCVRVLCHMAWALWPLGRAAERRALMTNARGIAEAVADPALLSQVLAESAAQISAEGDFDVAATLADEARSYAEATDDRWEIAMAAWARALAEANSAELLERVDQAAVLLKAAGNAFHFAALHHAAGNRALHCGSDSEALALCRRALPLVRELAFPYESMLLHGNVGLAALLSGDTEAARQAFHEQLELCRELALLPAAFQGVRGVAAVAAVRGDLDRAARLAGAAAAHRHGHLLLPIDARVDTAFLEPARRRLGAEAWDASAREGAALSFEEAIAYALGEPQAALAC